MKGGVFLDNKGMIIVNFVIGDGKIFVWDVWVGVMVFDVWIGRIVWEVDLMFGNEKDYFGSGGGVVYGGGCVFVIIGFGFVLVFDVCNGIEFWCEKLGLLIFVVLIVKGNCVYLMIFDN